MREIDYKNTKKYQDEEMRWGKIVNFMPKSRPTMQLNEGVFFSEHTLICYAKQLYELTVNLLHVCDELENLV